MDEDEEVQPVLIVVKDSSRPDTPERDTASNADGDPDDSMEASQVRCHAYVDTVTASVHRWNSQESRGVTLDMSTQRLPDTLFCPTGDR